MVYLKKVWYREGISYKVQGSKAQVLTFEQFLLITHAENSGLIARRTYMLVTPVKPGDKSKAWR